MEVHKRIPIKKGFFTTPLWPDEAISLAGSKCLNCGEVFLGKRNFCENCSSQTIGSIPFSQEGVLWGYTIIRHEPPPGYKVPGPFKPYGVGLVELPEGIRVMSPIDCDIDRLKIGMKLESVVYSLYENEAGEEVMAFKFKPVL